MVDNVITSNKVYVEGRIASEPEFSHEMYGEGFYNFMIEAARLSDMVDLLPITVSERLIDSLEIAIGKYIIVEGQLRSYNKYSDGGNRLILTIFARDMNISEEQKIPIRFTLMGLYVRSQYIGLPLLAEKLLICLLQ